MTNPHGNSSRSQQSPRGFAPGPQFGAPRPMQSQGAGYGQHGTAIPGSQQRGQGQFQQPLDIAPGMQQSPSAQRPPQKNGGSKKTLWTILGVIGAVVLVLGLSLFVAFQALKDATSSVSGNHNGAESLTPADDGYWDRTIDVDDIKTLRDSAGDAPVPSALSDLTSDCYEGTSYFGQSDDDGRDAHWVPTVECMFGDDNEFTAQYTENKEAIAAAESMGLQESIVDFSTARGSTIAGYIQDSDLVIVEVLANGEAVIEYLMLLTEDITGFDYDCMQRLVDAGILDSTPGPPFIDA